VAYFSSGNWAIAARNTRGQIQDLKMVRGDSLVVGVHCAAYGALYPEPLSLTEMRFICFVGQGASDKLLGSVLLLIAIVVYVYYTAWVILTVCSPFRTSNGEESRGSYSSHHLFVCHVALHREGPPRATVLPSLPLRDRDPGGAARAALHRRRVVHWPRHDPFQEQEEERLDAGVWQMMLPRHGEDDAGEKDEIERRYNGSTGR
jgi:hypothetical protein